MGKLAKPFTGWGIYNPKDHWTLKTGYFEDPTPAIQVQNPSIGGSKILREDKKIPHQSAVVTFQFTPCGMEWDGPTTIDLAPLRVAAYLLTGLLFLKQGGTC